MSECEKQLRDFIDGLEFDGNGSRYLQREDIQAAHDWLTTALLAEREKVAAKFAAFADERGEPMRVANPLPRTADNCIVVPFVSVVYHPNHPERTLDVDVCNDEVIGQVGVPDESRGTDWYEYPIAECYSTQAAATSALAATAKEQPNG